MEQTGKSSYKQQQETTELLGVKVPYNMIQNVGFELDIKISEVKIVKGVTDADFKIVYTIFE
jgi:hypothetical protein